MFCKGCGKEINDKAIICVHCMQPTGNMPPSNAPGAVDDTVQGSLVAVCILFPLIGLIIGLMKQSAGARYSGGKYIKYSVVTMIVCSVLSAITYAMWAFVLFS